MHPYKALMHPCKAPMHPCTGTDTPLYRHRFTLVQTPINPCTDTDKPLYRHRCTHVQALRFCTGCTAYGDSRGIALLFHDHGTKRRWGISVTPRPLFTSREDPVPIVQEAGWAPGLVWTGAENLDLTGVRYPDRPARSQSLYRLRYPILM
jgi:hypothetical protein